MTRVVDLDTAITDALGPFLPEGARATAVDPSKFKTLKNGAIWVKRIKSTAQWRGMAGTAAETHRRRSETLNVTLAAAGYRESSSHFDAALQAKATVIDLIVAVEQMLEADPDLSIGGAVDWSMLEEFLLETWPHESGWAAGAEITLKCESRP